MIATEPKTSGATRCASCDGVSFVKLSRVDGAIVREVYCPSCDTVPAARELTRSDLRRAAFVREAARVVAA